MGKGRVLETDEYLKMVRRQINAGARRVAEGDEPELADLASLRDTIEQAIADAVAGQRANGKTWAQIALGLGVTKNAALMRYGR